MRLSLDTHIALWAITDSRRLSARSRALIEDPDNRILISSVVLWEIAIKYGLNRGDANDMPIDAKAAAQWFEKAGFDELTVSWEDAALTSVLPKHHADPFDRLLVAQTRARDIWLLSHDPIVLKYGGNILPNHGGT